MIDGGGNIMIVMIIMILYMIINYKDIIIIVAIVFILIIILLILFKVSSFYQEWLHLYSTRRYGKQIKGLQNAWNILLHTLYNCTDGAYVSGL